MKKMILTGLLILTLCGPLFAGPDLRGLSFGVGPGTLFTSRPVTYDNGEYYYHDIYLNLTFDIKFNRIFRNGFTFINDLSYGFLLAGQEKLGIKGGTSALNKYDIGDYSYNSVIHYTAAFGYSPINKKHVYLSLAAGPSFSWVGMKNKGSHADLKTPGTDFYSHIIIGTSLIMDMGFFITKTLYINVGLRANWDFICYEVPANVYLDSLEGYSQFTLIPTFGIGFHFR